MHRRGHLAGHMIQVKRTLHRSRCKIRYMYSHPRACIAKSSNSQIHRFDWEQIGN